MGLISMGQENRLISNHENIRANDCVRVGLASKVSQGNRIGKCYIAAWGNYMTLLVACAPAHTWWTIMRRSFAHMYI